LNCEIAIVTQDIKKLDDSKEEVLVNDALQKEIEGETMHQEIKGHERYKTIHKVSGDFHS